MKTFKYLLYTTLLGSALSCTYDFPEETQPTSGSADFTKYVAIGNSLTSGFMNGALYNQGQQNSFPAIIAEQMEAIGGGGTFNQPDINSENGFLITAPLGPNVALGRLQLKYGCPDGTSAAPAPIGPGDMIGKYNGNPAELNNFGIPIIKLVYALDGPAASQNPYYARLFPSQAEAAATSPLALAAASGHTFFSMWLGNNDALSYGTGGGCVSASSGEFNDSPAPPQYLGVGPNGPIPNPAYPNGADYYKTLKPASRNGVAENDMTPVETFSGAYTSALNAMLGASAKGVIATIPDVTNIPYFTTISAGLFKIPLDLGQTIPEQAGPPLGGKTYAQVLNELYFQYGFTTMAEFEDYGGGNFGPKRIFTPDANNYLTIETLTEEGVRTIRQINPTEDLVILSIPTDSLGLGPIVKCNAPTGGLKAGWGLAKNIPLTTTGSIDLTQLDPSKVQPYPIPSRYILDTDEKNAVTARIAAYNDIIKSKESERIAVADFYAIFKEVANGTTVVNGINFTPTIVPPYGAFSLDGIHPNSRGYAYVANKFIEAINAKFNANLSTVNPNNYPSNDLPQ